MLKNLLNLGKAAPTRGAARKSVKVSRQLAELIAKKLQDDKAAPDSAEARSRVDTFQVPTDVEDFDALKRQRPDADAAVLDLITETTILRALQAEPKPGELAYYLLQSIPGLDEQISGFSATYYRALYPDLRGHAITPLFHYLVHGQSEGRTILRDARNRHRHLPQNYDPEKPDLLLFQHELSLSGSPIVAQTLAAQAGGTHNVVLIALDGGVLSETFEPLCSDIITLRHPLADLEALLSTRLKNVEYAVLNSAKLHAVLPFLVAHDIPIASYVHAYQEDLPPRFNLHFMTAFSDVMFFSSEHLRDRWSPHLKDVGFDIDRDSVILPQRQFETGGGPTRAEATRAKTAIGKTLGVDLSNAKLVLGAGRVSWRKGTDIFLMTAQIMQTMDADTHFIWIGDGRNHEDWVFGTWLEAHIEEMKRLENPPNIHFLPSGDTYSDLMIAADAFFLSSRMDPLPNVVFDAQKNGCEIVLFGGATGFDDDKYQSLPELHFAEYANPADAAQQLQQALARKRRRKSGTKPETLDLFGPISQALKNSQRLSESDRNVPVYGVSALFEVTDETSPAYLAEFRKLGRLGRYLYWQDIDAVRDALNASSHWVHKHIAARPFQHSGPSAQPQGGNLHIHAHYINGLGDLLARAAEYGSFENIYITTDTDRRAEDISRLVQENGLAADIRRVPNVGRDILPFLKLAATEGDDQTVWCHLHVKESRGSGAPAQTWRDFLYTILLGDADGRSNAADLIHTEKVGLVAPLDPFRVEWKACRRFKDEFSDRFSEPLPEDLILFPVGNMFWTNGKVARTMLSLFGDNYMWPNEPLPDDGTVFHLMERLWPSVAASLDLQSVFIDKPDQPRI